MENLTPETHSLVLEGDKPVIANNNVLLVNKESGDVLWAPWDVIQQLFYGVNDTEGEIDENENLDPQNNKLWNKDMTILLINKIENAQEAFEKGLKKNVWSKIAIECSSGATVITAKQVETKWKTLNRTYKSVLLHNKTTGQKRRYWEYFDLIHRFMHKKPEITPAAVCSNISGLMVKNDNTNESLTSEQTASTSQNEPAFESSFTRKRKQRESEIQKRHKEKMERLDRFNDLFSELVEVCKKKN